MENPTEYFETPQRKGRSEYATSSPMVTPTPSKGMNGGNSESNLCCVRVCVRLRPLNEMEVVNNNNYNYNNQ